MIAFYIILGSYAIVFSLLLLLLIYIGGGFVPPVVNSYENAKGQKEHEVILHIFCRPKKSTFGGEPFEQMVQNGKSKMHFKFVESKTSGKLRPKFDKMMIPVISTSVIVAIVYPLTLVNTAYAKNPWTLALLTLAAVAANVATWFVALSIFYIIAYKALKKSLKK